jgi:hypothetical protein
LPLILLSVVKTAEQLQTSIGEGAPLVLFWVRGRDAEAPCPRASLAQERVHVRKPRKH